MIIVDQADITDRLREQGWRLASVGVLVTLYDDPELTDPRRVAESYNADVVELDPRHPEHGFCRYCGAWMKRLTVAESHAYNNKLAENDPEDTRLDEIADPGAWVPVGDGGSVLCPKHDEGRDVHNLDHPLAVRMFEAGEWKFGGLEVQVASHDGIELGLAEAKAVPYGRHPHTIDRATGDVEYRPLNPTAFEEKRVQDLAREALDKAAAYIRNMERLRISAPVQKGQSS